MDKTVKEITATVLKHFLGTLKFAPKFYEQPMNKYGGIFFDKLKQNGEKLTTGLQIGLTKHYLGYVMWNLSQINDSYDEKTIEEYFKTSISNALTVVKSCFERDALVYSMYRSLKTEIDEIFDRQTLEIL